MGFNLTHYFKSERSFESDAQTEVFNLPSVGIISNLMIEVYALSGSQNADIFLSDVITKIEVIGNGSTVIKSYKGKHVQAIMCYDDGRFPPDKEYSPSGGCWGYFDVRFGRFPGDTKYALDCSKWNSLELKITYDLAGGGTKGTTGFTTSTGKFTIWGLYAAANGGISPVGYIKTEQKKTYTTTASGTYELDLPTDYPYRRLMLFQETLGSDVQHGFQYTTIDVNEGSHKPLDRMHGNDLRHWLSLLDKHDFTYIKRYYDGVPATPSYFYGPLRYLRNVHASASVQVGHLVWNQLDPLKFGITGDGASAGWVQLTMIGICPHGCLNIDLERLSGGLDGEEAMQAVWNCTQKDDIDLDFTAQVASLTLTVVLEQYVQR